MTHYRTINENGSNERNASRLKGIEHPNNRDGAQNKKFQKINSGTSASGNDVSLTMVSLRGASAKQFWDGLERLDEILRGLEQ